MNRAPLTAFASLLVVTVVTVVTVATSGCSLFGVRANPRVAKVTRDSETSRSSTTFDYSDEGRLTAVEDEFDILEFEWDDGVLTEVTRKDPDDDADDVRTELEYKNGRLVELKAEIGDGEDVANIFYDKVGRIEKIERDQFDGLSVQTSLYEFDDAGRVVEIVNKSVFDFDGELQRDESRTELEYEDGRLVTVTASSDTQEMVIDVLYEDGRLASLDLKQTIFADGDAPDQESEGTIEYEYNDEGLIAGADFETDQGEDGSFEIDYDDGEALDLDVTPTTSMFFLPFFDLRGQVFTNIDTRTQAARLAGVSW